MADVAPFRAIRYAHPSAGVVRAAVRRRLTPRGARRYLRARPSQRRPPDTGRLGGGGRQALSRPGSTRACSSATRSRRLGGRSRTTSGPDGVAPAPRGLVASLRAEPYETRHVLPHERTHAGPKESRLRLLRAARAQLEPIFLLYDGAAAGRGSRPRSGSRERRARASGGCRARSCPRRLRRPPASDRRRSPPL